MNDSYFVSKLNDLYIIAIVSNPHYSGGKIELGDVEDFYSYTSDVNMIIKGQAKFFASEIAGKISDKEELEEYLKVRLKEFLRIIND